jgi:hypothetical protein
MLFIHGLSPKGSPFLFQSFDLVIPFEISNIRFTPQLVKDALLAVPGRSFMSVFPQNFNKSQCKGRDGH